MNGHAITLAGADLVALPSGALWWSEAELLCVSDLHLCKAERVARRSGAMLPPYETRDTLVRLQAELAGTEARTIVCLGDSFDDLTAAAAIDADDRAALEALQVGRRWIWVEGNHDCGRHGLPGEQVAEWQAGPLLFRHIATAEAAPGEISGHYHPKAAVTVRGIRVSRPCTIYDERRAVMAAFGTYTGGLSWTAAPLRTLFPGAACAVLTGSVAHAVPVPRGRSHGGAPRAPRVPLGAGARR